MNGTVSGRLVRNRDPQQVAIVVILRRAIRSLGLRVAAGSTSQLCLDLGSNLQISDSRSRHENELDSYSWIPDKEYDSHFKGILQLRTSFQEVSAASLVEQACGHFMLYMY